MNLTLFIYRQHKLLYQPMKNDQRWGKSCLRENGVSQSLIAVPNKLHSFLPSSLLFPWQQHLLYFQWWAFLFPFSPLLAYYFTRGLECIFHSRQFCIIRDLLSLTYSLRFMYCNITCYHSHRIIATLKLILVSQMEIVELYLTQKCSNK